MDDPRSQTQDWRLPAQAKLPLVSELIERIDEALATARASEAAVMTVGAAALDAAEQARRAAELAERASAAMRAERTEPTSGRLLPSQDNGLGDFGARADRVAERLRRLQRVPLSA